MLYSVFDSDLKPTATIKIIRKTINMTPSDPTLIKIVRSFLLVRIHKIGNKMNAQ
jgi:hypothetical protein